jgi:hypothetical protein
MGLIDLTRGASSTRMDGGSDTRSAEVSESDDCPPRLLSPRLLLGQGAVHKHEGAQQRDEYQPDLPAADAEPVGRHQHEIAIQELRRCFIMSPLPPGQVSKAMPAALAASSASACRNSGALACPFKVNDSFGFGQKHVACARRALKGPGYAYKAG